MSLHLDWASHDAAKYAVKQWHYSGCMPSGKLVKIGVWEDGEFVGVVLFGWGASPAMYTRFYRWLGLERDESCELVRVALTKHKTPVSRIIAIAIRMLRKHCPGLRLIVSFADSDQGHHGGIYQAGNWIYTGLRKTTRMFVINGRQVHHRSMPVVAGRATLEAARSVDPNAYETGGNGKHQYLYVLDEELRPTIMEESQPYPKRSTTSTGSVDGDATATPGGGGRFDSDPGALSQTPPAPLAANG